MSIILPFTFVGISASIFLGVLFLSKRSGNQVSNTFLGLFFLILAIRLGKLFVQGYAPPVITQVYFNLMHAASLAMGPVVWWYIRAYTSPARLHERRLFIHFVPSALFLIGAFHLRYVSGETLWIPIYWAIQLHPLLYAGRSVWLLGQHKRSDTMSANQKLWLFSLIGTVVAITGMNMLYFTLDFPFYQVTALVLIMAVYLISFLAFNNKAHVLIGKSDRKYENQRLHPGQVDRLWKRVRQQVLDEGLYLEDRIKLADISNKLGMPPHIISRVVNESTGRNFPDYINSLRIESAKARFLKEPDKKVIAVALESGFHSLSAFNRAFKKHTGLSPSEYRAKYSGKKVSGL